MDRKDFYFEQLVTQADLDSVFDYAEAADRNLQADNGYVGIATGLQVTEDATPDLTVTVAAGTAYDQDGQRCSVAAPQILDLSIDSNAVSTAVAGGGNEKWVSVFIAFDRALSDPRVDGNGIPLQYERAESFQFIVDQGAEAAAGTPAVYTAGSAQNYPLANGQTLLVVVDDTPTQTVTFLTGDFVLIGAATAAEVAAVFTAQLTGITGGVAGPNVTMTTAMTGPGASVRVIGGTAAVHFDFPAVAAVGAGGPSRPALRADAMLLADVLFRNGGTAIIDAPDDGSGSHVIDAWTRRQTVFAYTGAAFEIKAGTITEFADALAQELTNHINEVGASHPAAAIGYDPGVLPVPAAWSSLLAAGDVQAAVDGVVDDLAQATGTTGADLVGYDNSVTTNPLPGAPATVQDALESLLSNAGTVNLDAGLYDLSGSVNVVGPATAEDTLTVAGQLTANGELETNALLDVNGNVNFGGTTWTKADPAHNFTAPLILREYSAQYVNAAALQTDDVVLYFNAVTSTAGIIRGAAVVWTNNTGNSFVSIEFTVPFTLVVGNTPAIPATYALEGGGSSAVVRQGGAPTSASLSVVASTNTISFRVTHNAGPTTRNLLLQWSTLTCNLNQ